MTNKRPDNTLSRTIQLTDAGRATVQAARAARYEARGATVMGWVTVPAEWLAPRPAGEAEDAGGDVAEPGAYYTPQRILDIIEPQAGSGAFLAELASNPPYGEGE